MDATITPLAPHVGAVITGTSGNELAKREAADECLRLLEQYGVLAYRDVHITDEDFINFSRFLGHISTTPNGEHQYPEIETITLDPLKGNPALVKYREGNFFWHFDGSTYELPQKATLLSAQEVDDGGGGDTEFACTFAAHAALSEAEQAEIADLHVLHSVAASQLLFTPNPTEKQRAVWDQVPTRTHPLVWTNRHGRKSLLLGSTSEQIVGWPVDKSRALLDRLLEWSTQPEFVVRHHWSRGDLVIWDNTGMLHRALPFESTSPRLLHRITLAGEAVAA